MIISKLTTYIGFVDTLLSRLLRGILLVLFTRWILLRFIFELVSTSFSFFVSLLLILAVMSIAILSSLPLWDDVLLRFLGVGMLLAPCIGGLKRNRSSLFPIQARTHSSSLVTIIVVWYIMLAITIFNFLITWKGLALH